MTWSISTRAATKEAAKAQARTALEAQLESQSAHAGDKKAIYQSVEGAIESVQEVQGYDIVCTGYGHCSSDTTNGTGFTEINVKAYRIQAAEAA